jgi:hypothetical protein
VYGMRRDWKVPLLLLIGENMGATLLDSLMRIILSILVQLTWFSANQWLNCLRFEFVPVKPCSLPYYQKLSL